MRNATILLLLTLLFLPTVGNAQITITEARFTDLIGKSFREVLYESNQDIGPQLSELIAANGNDENWDFSNLNYVDSTVVLSSITLVDPNDPNLSNPNLAGATHLWMDVIPPVTGGSPDTSFQYRYGNFADGRYSVRGALSILDFDNNGDRDTFAQWFSPPTLQLTFPIALGAEWHDSTSLIQDLMGAPTVSSIMLDSNWVEGWGQLTTPAGTMPALRLREKEIDKTPGFPIQTVSNSIEFLSIDGSIEGSINLEDEWAFHRVLSITGDSPTSTSFPVEQRFGVTGVYPNPVKDIARIVFRTEKQQRISFSILDMQGATVTTLETNNYPTGEHELRWSPTSLSAGSYLLRMQVGNQSVLHKVMVMGN